jgi:hypothetical protein
MLDEMGEALLGVRLVEAAGADGEADRHGAGGSAVAHDRVAQAVGEGPGPDRGIGRRLGAGRKRIDGVGGTARKQQSRRRGERTAKNTKDHRFPH